MPSTSKKSSSSTPKSSPPRRPLTTPTEPPAEIKQDYGAGTSVENANPTYEFVVRSQLIPFRPGGVVFI